MEKLSSHFKGQGERLPSCSDSTRIFRENMPNAARTTSPATEWLEHVPRPLHLPGPSALCWA
jgi:hypothetical protein